MKSASCWSLLRKYITMHGPEYVKLPVQNLEINKEFIVTYKRFKCSWGGHFAWRLCNQASK